MLTNVCACVQSAVFKKLCAKRSSSLTANAINQVWNDLGGEAENGKNPRIMFILAQLNEAYDEYTDGDNAVDELMSARRAPPS